MKVLSEPINTNEEDDLNCDDPDCQCSYQQRKIGTPQDQAVLRLYLKNAENQRHQKRALWCSLLTMAFSIPALLGA